eukprot:365555-Chlamydomonas_euryale.AAC.23
MEGGVRGVGDAADACVRNSNVGVKGAGPDVSGTQARKKLLSTARALLNDWQRHSKPAVAADVADGTDGAALEGRVSAPGPQVSASPPDANVRSALSDVDEQQLQPQKQQQREQGQQAGHDEDGRGGRPRGVASVAPGSFLDLLLAARKRQAHVQPLNDLQIIAQVGQRLPAGRMSASYHAILSMSACCAPPPTHDCRFAVANFHTLQVHFLFKQTSVSGGDGVHPSTFPPSVHQLAAAVPFESVQLHLTQGRWVGVP